MVLFSDRLNMYDVREDPYGNATWRTSKTMGIFATYPSGDGVSTLTCLADQVRILLFPVEQARINYGAENA